MENMASQMDDPAAPLPWDSAAETLIKTAWRLNVPDVIGRRKHAEWSLGGPEGFTRALKFHGIFGQVRPQDVFSPVHYTGWRWNFDGTLYLGHERFANSLGVHLWGELLRREPDALDCMSPSSLVAQLMLKYDVAHTPLSIPEAPLPKILVGVCSCSSGTERRRAIRETWLLNRVPNINPRNI
jgi:hypothetical protein